MNGLVPRSILVAIALLTACSIGVAASDSVEISSSEVIIEEEAVEDATAYNYSLDTTDGVRDLTVEITGRTNRVAESTTSTVSDGDVLDPDIGGNTQPENGEVSISGRSTPTAPTEAWSFSRYSPREITEIGGSIYLTGYGGNVSAVDAETGVSEWNTSVIANTEYLLSITGGDGSIYTTDGNGNLYALDTSGSVQWSDSLDGSPSIESMAYSEETSMLYLGDRDGKIYGYDPAAQSVEWSHSAHSSGSYVYRLRYHNETLYSAGGDGSVNAFDVSTRSTAWNHSIHSVEVRGLSIDRSEEVLYSGDNDGLLIGYDLSNQTETLSVNRDPAIQALTYSGGVIYTSDYNGKEVATDAESGSVVWSEDLGSIRYLSANSTRNLLYAVDLSGDRLTASTVREPTANVSVALDGSTVIEETGVIGDTETVSSEVSLTRNSSIEISTEPGTKADLTVSRTEVTQAVDPEISINNETVSHSGVLSDGETVILTPPEESIEEDTNVSISVSTATGEPSGLIDLDYSHWIGTSTDSSTGSTVGAVGGAAAASSGGGFGLPPTVLLLGTTVSLLGVFVVGRRLGIESRRGYGALLSIGVVIGVVALEAVTDGSVVAEITAVVASGGEGSGFRALLLSIGVIVALWVVRSRFGVSDSVLSLLGLGVAVWLVDSISGGALTGGLGEISPIFWLGALAFAGYLLYVRLSPRDITLIRGE